MVLDANAVIEPDTVVVISLHTLVASAAMEGPWRLDDEAFGAELNWVYDFQQLKKVKFSGFLDEARVTELNHEPGDHCKHSK
jgi:hypothetical protein